MDGQNTSTKKAIAAVIDHLHQSEKTVYTNQPDTTKMDYNDLLKSHGARAIQEKVENSSPAMPRRDEDMEHIIQHFDLKDKDALPFDTSLQKSPVKTAIQQKLAQI